MGETAPASGTVAGRRLGDTLLEASGAVLAVMLTAGFLAWMVTAYGGAAATTAVAHAGELVAALTCGLLCLGAAQLQRTGRPWLLLALAAFAWAAGEAVRSYFEVIAGGPAPAPSPADAGFLLAVPLEIAAVLLFFPRGSGNSRLRVLLDGGVIAASLAVVGWITVLKAVVAGDGGALRFAVGLAHPVGDVTTLAVVVTAIGYSRRLDWAPALMCLGLVTIATTNGAVTYITATGGSDINPIVAGWVAGFLLVGAGALHARSSRTGPADAGGTSARLLVPYVPLAVAAAVVGYQLISVGSVDRVTAYAAVVLAGLVVVREVIAGREVAALTRDLELTVGELRRRETELSFRALHDPLTGLANRQLFQDRLEMTLAESERSGRRPAVLFLDLDDLKAINDSMGHDAGDRLLVAVAQRLRAALRPADTVARLSGDEFAVVIPDGGEGMAEKVAERLLHSVCDSYAMQQDFHLGVSIGVAVAQARAFAADLVREADVAMYAAKDGGKGRWMMFEPAMLALAPPSPRPGEQDGEPG